MPDRSTCVTCAHFEFIDSQPAYSEWTPGCDANIACLRGEYDIDLESLTVPEYAETIRRAQSCGKHETREESRERLEAERKAEAAERASACPNCGAAPANLLGAVDYENGVTSYAYDCGASIEYANGEFFRRIAPCGNQPKPEPMSAKASLALGAPSIG